MHAPENVTYADNERVPYPPYRCPSSARDTSKLAHTHLCKRHIDHEEDKHVCICGKSWPRVDSL